MGWLCSRRFHCIGALAVSASKDWYFGSIGISLNVQPMGAYISTGNLLYELCMCGFGVCSRSSRSSIDSCCYDVVVERFRKNAPPSGSRGLIDRPRRISDIAPDGRVVVLDTYGVEISPPFLGDSFPHIGGFYTSHLKPDLGLTENVIRLPNTPIAEVQQHSHC